MRGRGIKLSALSMTLLLAACGGVAEETPPSGDTLEMTRETVDGVEHVRNTSGSTWGASALLVEDLSVGVLEGEEPYMFGQILSVAMGGDRIYALDRQVPAVRAYDLNGQYVRDIGGAGEGPGEYSRPFGMAVDYEDRIWVHAGPGQGTIVYTPDGEVAAEWRSQGNFFSSTLIPTRDGAMYTSYFEMPEMPSGRNEVRMVIGGNTQGVAPMDLDNGGYGEPLYPPETDFEPTEISIEVSGTSLSMGGGVYEPQFLWAMGADRTMVSGVSDRYAFDITAPDGTTTSVERYWEPVALDPAEAEDRIDQMFGSFRQRDPDWQYPVEVPTTKPAFNDLSFDRDGRIWVARSGPGVLDEACAEAKANDPNAGAGAGGGGIRASGGMVMITAGGGESCWRSPTIHDVFAADGRYLGEVLQPEGLRFVGERWIEGDVVLVAVEDEEGTLMIKKYRLVTPSDT